MNVLLEEKICGPMHDNSFTADDERTSTAHKQLEQILDALDAQLEGNNFVIGEYSYADIHWTAIAHLCTLVGEEGLIGSRSNVKAWYDRVKGRSSFASLPSLEDIKHKQLRSVA